MGGRIWLCHQDYTKEFVRRMRGIKTKATKLPLQNFADQGTENCSRGALRLGNLAWSDVDHYHTGFLSLKVFCEWNTQDYSDIRKF